MRKWILACAVVTVGCFLAEPVAPAQEVVQAQGTVISSSQPRMGLFRRVRERREMRVEPVTMRTSSMSTTAQSSVVPAQSTTPSTTTPSTTTPSTTPSTSIATLPTTQAQPRQGLLARLRARR